MIVTNARFSLLVLVGLALTSGADCQAGYLTTTFSSNNLLGAPAGNFFDVAVGNSPLQVTSLDVNVLGTAGQAFGVTVYEKLGTYLGSEQNSSAWTVASTGTGISSGIQDIPDLVSLNTPFIMNAQTTYGWFVTITTANAGLILDYTNGTGSNQVYSNSDLTLTAGASESSYFGQLFSPESKVFQNRVWDGTIDYGVVPEPASFAMVGSGLTSALGYGAWRRRRRRTARSAA